MGTAASTISNPTINIEHHECDLTTTTERHECDLTTTTTTTSTTPTQQVDFRW
jgi:hypothetical protein